VGEALGFPDVTSAMIGNVMGTTSSMMPREYESLCDRAMDFSRAVREGRFDWALKIHGEISGRRFAADIRKIRESLEAET